jgi:hypothetical protein
MSRMGAGLTGMTMLAVLLAPQAVRAQDAPPPAPPPPPPAVIEVAPPAPPPPPLPPPVIAEEVKPPTATEAMPATRPDMLPPITVGAWTRVGGKFQNANDPKKLNDFAFDNAYVELHVGGKIHKKVGVTLNLNSNITKFPGPNFDPMTEGGAYVAIMDAIVQFDMQDEFHLWAGHLLVPVDRSNASGPFFMIPWNYPGFFTPVGVGAPKEGPSGRNNGAVVWGDIMGGKFTYLAGVFDNGSIASSPLFSGRLRLALLDPEGGFWGNGSYFGEKDLLTIGVGAQFQKNGSGVDKDWAEVNGDVLFEKKIPGGGWVTAEAGYYHFNVLDGGVSDSFYGLAAYATPTIGVGNIQPSVRYQMIKIKAGMGDSPYNLDAGLAYLIKGPALRLVGNFTHTKLGTDATGMDLGTANALQLGVQAIFF